MKVADFMTAEAVTIQESASLEAALRLMDDCAIRHLPVVEGERLIGVISERDLLAVVGTGRHGAKSAPASDEVDRPRWVSDIMHRDVVTVSPEDSAVAAATEVSVRSIGCLPVLEDGRLAGIVSDTDLVRLVSETADQRRGAVPSLAKISVPRAIACASTATLEQVDQMMYAKAIRHAPVMEDDRLVGVVSDRDLRRAAGEGLDGSTPVADVMTKEVVTVSAGSSIADAAAVMSDRRIGALIIEDGGEGFGIVTLTDLVAYALESV